MNARRHWHRASMGGLLAILLPAPGVAWACTSVTDGVASAMYPVVLNERESFDYSFGAAGVEFAGCSGSAPTEFEVELDTPMKLLGTVQYRGLTFGKFQVSDTSPLVLLGVYARDTSSRTAFTMNGQTLLLTVNPRSRVTLMTEISVSGRRNVESEPISRTSQLRIRPRSNPALVGTGTLEMGFDVSVIRDCTVHGATLALDDLPANLLTGPGNSAGEKEFVVDMTCSHDNLPVKLTLTDAHAPGNSSSLLSAAPGSDAGGVQIELLRNNLPVQLGTPWSYGMSQTGRNPISLSARYVANGNPLGAGAIVGEAILMADYP
ncbi:fimbrial protein [Stenotrophomonas sp.]|uniref:fimbrial protein n=1 Tax=Stenotrophomonas sp. TaxID=69392 RepID=UPI002D41E03F|nr:fimbrial protein [Stenotrophomonas sp.]HYQ22421.1 fimbrial protein [Stenotrophomonas sp.]